MKKNWLKVSALILACAFVLSTQAFAGYNDNTGQGDQDKTRTPGVGDDCPYLY